MEDNKIRGGDIVVVQHSELQGLLTADYNYKTKLCECFVRNYHGEFEEEMNSANSLWEVETVYNNERGRELLFSSMEGSNGDSGKGKSKKDLNNDEDEDTSKSPSIAGESMNYPGKNNNNQDMFIKTGNDQKGGQ